MEEHCFSYFRFLSSHLSGKENVPVLVPPRGQAEAHVESHLSAMREDPSLCACFVLGTKTWKSRAFFLSLRHKAHMKVLARGSKGEAFTHLGQRGTFPFSFVLVFVPPKPTCSLGTIGETSPLNLTFHVSVKGVVWRALLDTGATHSFVKSKVLRGMSFTRTEGQVTLADGTLGSTLGKVDLSVKLTPTLVSRHAFLVCDNMLETVDIILGQDWLSPREAVVYVAQGKVHLKHNGKWVTLDSKDKGAFNALRWGWNCLAKGMRKVDEWKQCLLNVITGHELDVWDDQGVFMEGNVPDLVTVEGLDSEETAWGKGKLCGTSSGTSWGPSTPGGSDPMVLETEGETGKGEEDEEMGLLSGEISNPLEEVCKDKPEPLQTLLHEFTDLFPTKLPGLPPLRQVYHTINLVPGMVPPNRPAYRLSLVEQEECVKTVDELLALGLIRPSCSAFASPVLFVRKKEGTYRMVIDYRALNKITVPDRYPLPRIDDLLDRLKGAKVFSSLDLLSGYHQVRLRQEDIPKTAFRTPFGLYEFLVLPFGLTNAPATFQRLMNEIFHDFIREGFVVVYLDDVLIFSKNTAEHYEHLRRVFVRLQETGLFAKLAKCEFLKPELRYLGHVIGREGLKVDPQKITVVQEWPTPQNVTDVRRFLGLANYFRKFVRNYSDLAAPLTQLSSSKREWEWGKEQEHAFLALKEALVCAPILALPDLRREFQVICDASDFGVGAVLLQDGRVIAYYSKKLNSAERNYSATERELLAVVYALTEWRCYVLGKQVTVTTDHQCNTYLQQQVGLSPRRARWAERLQEFEILWVWEPGKSNVADALSRIPNLAAAVTRSASTREPTPQSPELQPSMGRGGGATPSATTQQSDKCVPLLERIVGAYASDEWLGRKANRRKVHFRDGIWEFGKEGRKYVPVYYETREGEEMVTRNLRQELLASLHDPPYVGHPGFAKMYELVKRAWWWPGMAEDIREYVKYCDSCQRVKASNKLPAGLLHPLQIPTRKWQSISMDFITGLPRSARGSDAIWVVVDRLSKCAHFVATTTRADSYDVAVLFRDKVWRYHGFPEEIVSDRDPRFINNFMNVLLSLTGCKPARSTAYHPQSDGQTERVNRVLEDYLRHYVKHHHREWEEHLAAAEFAYNNSWHASLNSTPFRLTYGQDPNIPFALGHMEGVRVDRADLFMRKMHEGITLARRCLAAAQARQAAAANRKRREEEFQVGTLVLLDAHHLPHVQSSNRCNKFATRWIGPFTVEAVVNRNSYKLRLPPTLRIHSSINITYLKRYHWKGSAPPPTEVPLPYVVEDEDDGTLHLEWKVEEVREHRQLVDSDGIPWAYRDGTPYLEYYTKWLGFPEEECTWEALYAFARGKDRVNAYHRRLGMAPPRWEEDPVPVLTP